MPGRISKRIKSKYLSKNRFLNVYGIIIHNSQSVETPKYPSANGRTRYSRARNGALLSRMREWSIVNHVGTRHQRDMTGDWPASWTQTFRGSSPSPVLGMWLSQRLPWDGAVLWKTQLRPLYKLPRLGGRTRDLGILLPPKTTLDRKLPSLLLPLLPASLEWLLPRPSPCPPITGTSFRSHPGSSLKGYRSSYTVRHGGPAPTLFKWKKPDVEGHTSCDSV